MNQDVIIDFQQPSVRRPQVSPWQLALQRVARAQAIVWSRTPIAERIKLLQQVEDEMNPKGESK